MFARSDIAIAGVALLAVVGFAAGESKGTESAPKRLRIPRQRQIELAMSAAPAEISMRADVYVLEKHGYVKVRSGANGFSCLVEHEYPSTYEPVCYDREGTATLLPARLHRETLRAAGRSEREVAAEIERGFREGRFIAPRKPGFAYMLSTDQRVFDPLTGEVVAGRPHLMFYAPYARSSDFGGFIGLHAPFVVFEGRPDAFLVVVPEAIAAGEGPGRP